jgi:protein-S-isoprenylcysteine O-methyltransferase Ste14
MVRIMWRLIKNFVKIGVFAGVLGWGTWTGRWIIAGCAVGIIVVLVLMIWGLRTLFKKREA